VLFTVIVLDVAFVFQSQDTPWLAVSFTESPEQNFRDEPAVTTAFGKGFTLTTRGSELEAQLFVSVIFTVYVPAFLTIILLEVALVFQR
jgi:hypothetical protein